MSRLTTLCAILLAVGLVSTLSSNSVKYQDCGSCGNACCLMEFKFAMKPSDVYSMFVNTLKAGGSDKLYRFVKGSDIRKDNLTSGAQYRIQATHPSMNTSFDDSLSFVLASNSSSVTIVRGFSISPIEVSLCDSAQNYRNLENFVKGLSQDYAEKFSFGCADTMG